MTRLLVTGKNGQVGWELQRSLQCLGEVVAVDRTNFDLAHPETLIGRLDELAPDIIVNAAAYTAVDKAESEEALASRINGESPSVMATWAARRRALLVHYSSDYVFDGTACTPYSEEATACPINAYGRSKLAGEAGIRKSGCEHLILRTTWVYASRGKNFLLTMLRLASERDELSIVDDQVGAPTWARNIADATAHAIFDSEHARKEARFTSGTFNLVAHGSTSWFGFAEEILAKAERAGLVDPLLRPRMKSIATAQYPTPAKRPANSVLDPSALTSRFGLKLPDWRDALDRCIDELPR